MTKTLLIVDGSNSFMRHYMAHSGTTSNGMTYGGVIGFLQSLQSFIDLVKPSKVLITFDDPSGSKRRRKILPEYKKNRKPMRLNRHHESDEDEEKKNKKLQSLALLDYLSDLPVHVMRIANAEADDVIAYVKRYMSEWRKVVVSSDNDFLQLLDNMTIIYRPQPREFVTQKDCFEKYQIHPRNFALARAFIGDRSDDCPGVPGIGYKTLLKFLPQISGVECLELQDVLAFCEASEDKKVRRLAEYRERIEKNYDVMDLSDPVISMYNVSKIQSALSEAPVINTTELRLKIMRDGINLHNNFMQTFLTLSLAGKKHD